MSTRVPYQEEPRRPGESGDGPAPAADGREELEGAFGNVFGGEIPEGERAWRRGGEAEGTGQEEPAVPDAVTWALQALPTALREIRAEVRRATDLATDALAAQADPETRGEARGDTSRPFDPLPTALRELRDEVREAVDRATESLAATRKGAAALPAIVGAVRDEFERLSARLTDALTAANLEAARAFSMVAREVRTLGDRQAVLREEVRLLGKRFEELDRLRRRQGYSSRTPSRPATTTPE